MHFLVGGSLLMTIFGILIYGKAQTVARLLAVLGLMALVVLILIQDPPKSAPTPPLNHYSNLTKCLNFKPPTDTSKMSDDDIVLWHQQIHGMCGK